jgi:hypothetical protein
MKTRVFMLAAAMALCAPAAANAATVPVQQIKGGPFSASNSTVIKTPDGVHFGTYADATQLGGSLEYNGLNGRPLSALTHFGYTFNYRERGNTTGAAPYMRVFLDEDPGADTATTGDPDLDAALGFNDGVPDNDIDHDVVLDPGENGTNVRPQATDVTVSTDDTSVRFDDDPGAGPQSDYADLLADPTKAGLTIIDVLVSQGFSTGADVSGLVRSMTLNTTTFAFDVPPVGQPGPAGPATIVRVPVFVPGAAQPATQGVLGTQASSCEGDDLLALHAPRRAGQRFVSARATLRGKRLEVKGRSIRLDLRGRSEGNYDVRIVARYRTKSGRVVRVVTHRVRSVAC